MSDKRIAVIGAAGRMGREVLTTIAATPNCCVGAAIENQGVSLENLDGLVGDGLLTDNLVEGLLQCDVAIDFSTSAGFDSIVDALQAEPTPIISGTTGLSETQMARFHLIAETVPVLHSPNMSVGVQVLLELIDVAVKALGPTYDIEIVESHHRNKKDAPSGTAKRLHEAVREAQRQLLSHEPNEIPVHAIRGGDVVGDHSILLMGDGDRIEITHRATARRTFAVGAVRAANWLISQPRGVYTMKDFLGA